MAPILKKWLKPGVALLVAGLLAWLCPSEPLDPWNLLNLRNIATLIFALLFIQVFGVSMGHIFGSRMGSVLTGFFGGLVSSTATTASLSRQSKIKKNQGNSSEALIFLAATLAMLFEAVALTVMGTEIFHWSLMLIFIAPILTTVGLIYFYTRKVDLKNNRTNETSFLLLPILKLAFFIVFILLLSKFLQKFFGQYGLLALTFLVSLFEIHGSIIANVQLHETGSIDTKLLCSLLVVSVAASYLSKLFLIYTIGSTPLKHLAIKWTFFLFLSLLFGWMASVYLA